MKRARRVRILTKSQCRQKYVHATSLDYAARRYYTIWINTIKNLMKMMLMTQLGDSSCFFGNRSRFTCNCSRLCGRNHSSGNCSRSSDNSRFSFISLSFGNRSHFTSNCNRVSGNSLFSGSSCSSGNRFRLTSIYNRLTSSSWSSNNRVVVQNLLLSYVAPDILRHFS